MEGVYALNNTCSGALQINAPVTKSRDRDAAEDWLGSLFADKELLPLETWVPNDEEILMLGGRIECSGNVCTNGGLMLNAPINTAKGIYAPGICREWGPDGGVVVPWSIAGGWYACEGGIGTWGYHDVDSDGPCQRDLQTSFSYRSQQPQSQKARLCANCAAIPLHRLAESPDFEHTLVTDPSMLRVSSAQCQICQWIWDFFRRHDSCTQGLSASTIRMSFVAGKTAQASVASRSSGRDSFCVGKLQVAQGRRQHHAPRAAFHVLHHRGSHEYMSSLSAWLAACDKHDHANVFSSVLPTRVLDLGGKPGPYYDEDLRLLEADGSKGTYLALSHRWGDTRPLRTTIANLRSHLRHIGFSGLPRTFKDAVLVTRALGIQYLWIDSLCIVQDDPDDWARESILMEKIFASAYCTVSAASSPDSTCGFLARNDEKCITMPGPSGQPWDVVNFDEDFRRDVESGVLQSRAWVFQERALSRRTLHFTDSQTYLECGSGISCETAGFVPEQSSVLTRRDLFGKTLLWQRWTAADMRPIPSFKKGRVPTWSWMSMVGEISYLPVPEEGTLWKRDFKIALPKVCVYETVRFLLAAPLQKLHPDCWGAVVEDAGGDHYTTIREEPTSQVVGWIRYDEKLSCQLSIKEIAFVTIASGIGGAGETIAPPSCKIEAVTHSYVLVVLKTTVADLHLSMVYRRLGVGVVAQDCLAAGHDLVAII